MKHLFPSLFVSIVALLIFSCTPVSYSVDDVTPESVVAGAVTALSTIITTGISQNPRVRRGPVTQCDLYAQSNPCYVRKAEPNVGLRSSEHDSCPFGVEGLTYSDSITLRFDDKTCPFPAGGSVNWTGSFSRETPNHGTDSVESTPHTDYRGISLDPAGAIFKTGFALQIGAIRQKRLAYDFKTFRDVSLRTLTDMTISDPSVSPISINGGSLEAIHNNGKFVATLVPTSVVYDLASCCHPSSGSFSASFSGSVSGTGSINFNSICGWANLTLNGVTTSVLLPECD